MQMNTKTVCWEFGHNTGHKGTDPDIIKKGAVYLMLQGHKSKAAAHLGAGTKGTCGRVSCERNSGIYFCQDVSFDPYTSLFKSASLNRC